METWVDSHCHLDHVSFQKDLTAVLERAKDRGVHQFIIPATGFHQWEQQQQIIAAYPETKAAYGIHPWFCDLHEERHMEQLDELLDQAIAVGECGLDFMPDKPDRKKQQWWFEAQVKLAEKHQLPLIIHSVRAGEQVYQTLKNHPGVCGVVHGFSGSLEQAKALIQLGFMVGIGSRFIRQNSEKHIRFLKEIPLQFVLLESDAPDGLGKSVRNEPSGLILVANIIANLKNIPADTVLRQCSLNATELFRL